MLRKSLGVCNDDALRIGSDTSFRVKIFCSLWYAGALPLLIELASGSDVTGSERVRIRFMVRHGLRQWTR